MLNRESPGFSRGEEVKFDWIPWLWSTMNAFGSTWAIGFAIVGGLGLVGAGATFALISDKNGYREPDYFGICGGIIGTSAVVGLFWPLILIALPFIATACALFGVGIFITNSVTGSRELAGEDEG